MLFYFCVLNVFDVALIMKQSTNEVSRNMRVVIHHRNSAPLLLFANLILVYFKEKSSPTSIALFTVFDVLHNP